MGLIALWFRTNVTLSHELADSFIPPCDERKRSRSKIRVENRKGLGFLLDGASSAVAQVRAKQVENKTGSDSRSAYGKRHARVSDVRMHVPRSSVYKNGQVVRLIGCLRDALTEQSCIALCP